MPELEKEFFTAGQDSGASDSTDKEIEQKDESELTGNDTWEDYLLEHEQRGGAEP